MDTLHKILTLDRIERAKLEAEDAKKRANEPTLYERILGSRKPAAQPTPTPQPKSKYGTY